MTIEIPDYLAPSLERVAAAQQKTVEQIVVDRLQPLLDRKTSPQSILRKLRALPPIDTAAIDDLDASIAASKLPVREHSAFDD